MPTTWSCNRATDLEWLSPGIWVYDNNGALSQFSGVEFNCNHGALFRGAVMCVDSYATCDDTLVVNPGNRVGDEGPAIASGGAVTFVPTFTHVAFSSAQVNGLYLGDWSPIRYNLATHGNVLQDKTNLLGTEGTAFSTTFVHN